MKPFSETKVGQWIKNNAPDAIGYVENFVPAPVKGGLDILKNIISKNPGISVEKLQEFNTLVSEYEIELIKEANANTADARNREVEITKILSKKDWALYILAAFGVLAPFSLIMYLISHMQVIKTMDPGTAALIGGFIGIIISSYPTVFNYFFGSSSGSAKKQDTIDAMMKKD